MEGHQAVLILIFLVFFKERRARALLFLRVFPSKYFKAFFAFLLYYLNIGGISW